jgi:hypothetical protein
MLTHSTLPALPRRYASFHFALVSLPTRHKLWPYPADVPHIRLMLLGQMMSCLFIAGVEAFAIYMVASNVSLSPCVQLVTDDFVPPPPPPPIGL